MLSYLFKNLLFFIVICDIMGSYAGDVVSAVFLFAIAYAVAFLL